MDRLTASLKQWLKQSPFLVATGHAVRIGLQEWRQRQWRRQQPARVRAYLAGHAVRKLQLGTGYNLLPGWLNTDLRPKSDAVVFLDAAEPFPFDDATFHYILAEHLLEHLTFHQGQAMLRECCRVLKPGGTLRLSTPLVETVVALYDPRPSAARDRYVQWTIAHYCPEAPEPRPCFVANSLFRNFGHQFLYDRPTLHRAVALAGFVDLVECRPGHSRDAHLQGVERRARDGDQAAVNEFETLVVEARRPG